tara:strand:+ start:342 stop:590 length:249 start_codon:yes stop_codon:yes gene_type:complete
MKKDTKKINTSIELSIAALASIKDIASIAAVKIINVKNLKALFLEFKNKKIAKGILKAIEAAVIFLLPAKPLMAITLNPSLG